MKRLTLLFAALALAAPAPTWRIIGPGGGGTLFWPTISPHDPNVVLTACDMTGGYITRDAGRTWRMFSLGAPPRFFVFDPLNPKVFYASANGLFRTTDAGATWTRFYPRTAEIEKATMGDDHAEARLVYPTEPQGQITALAIDPADSASLTIAVTAAGKSALWQSLDTGASWRKIA